MNATCAIAFYSSFHVSRPHSSFCISSFATAVASSRETRPTHCLGFAALREIKIMWFI
ncbi:MAG: hypothetical protein KME31_37565 [Tolypothrix carrinoi HA7290-LM1]|nr:hypothetical protein [Tolypothrix carrinoi HA7290-LM1]